MSLFFTFFFISPSYDATASIYVNNSSFSFGSTSFSISSSELNASNSLVNTYIYILKSRTTLEDVISTAELPYTFEKLSKMISTNAVTGTAAFDVTVRSSSPTEAEHIANTIAQVLPERIAEIVDGSSVRIVDYAIVPAHRSAPSYTKNVIIGFLAGVLFRKGLLRRSRVSLCIFGAIATVVIYGGIMNPAAALIYANTLDWKLLLSYYVSGIPVDLIHATATVLFLWLAAEPMLEKLDRIKVKYGLME